MIPCGDCKQGLVDGELCPRCHGTVLLDNDTKMDDAEKVDVVAPTEETHIEEVPAAIEVAPEVAPEEEVAA